MTFTVEIYRIYSFLKKPLICWLWSSPLWYYRTWKTLQSHQLRKAKSLLCVWRSLSKSQSHKQNSPLLFPSGPLRMVHSSMLPKDSKRRRTSSSDCCLLSMPTKSFLSSKREEEQITIRGLDMHFVHLHIKTMSSKRETSCKHKF